MYVTFPVVDAKLRAASNRVNDGVAAAPRLRANRPGNAIRLYVGDK